MAVFFYAIGNCVLLIATGTIFTWTRGLRQRLYFVFAVFEVFGIFLCPVLPVAVEGHSDRGKRIFQQPVRSLAVKCQQYDHRIFFSVGFSDADDGAV